MRNGSRNEVRPDRSCRVLGEFDQLQAFPSDLQGKLRLRFQWQPESLSPFRRRQIEGRVKRFHPDSRLSEDSVHRQ
ncbi:hypothetical protein [Propionivibrio sp.]|uniref:hypothetical protein n=1 Tax=Propionivibrio sp. TaxID=2212460 RepID=UPI0025D24D74|nr:hypothetical protein [Propionivibrio sp.]